MGNNVSYGILALVSTANGNKAKKVIPNPPVSIALNVASDFLRFGNFIFLL
jgi:hypothetical protein